MESFRLKNIIILILALMNLFLLGSLYGRASAQQEAQDRIRQQLVELFSSDSARIALDGDIISFQTPPSGGTLTRAELVTILYRVEGSPEAAYKGTFKDVKEGQWYTAAIEWAAANEIVKGVGDGTNFDPSGVITREQIATILYRYTGEPKVEGDLNKFPDVKEISSFAATAMIWANQEGIINGVTVNGVNKLAPKDSATREQIASIMMRYLEAE
mgnify:CR=1 FL=1